MAFIYQAVTQWQKSPCPRTPNFFFWNGIGEIALDWLCGEISTHGYINLTTLLVKHYNDLLTRRRSGRARNKVTYFSVGDVFCIHLGITYAKFQEKIFPETSGKKFQNFHCSNVTTMKSLELFPRRFRGNFFLKIGILRAKVYTKNFLNIEVCDFIPGSSRTSPI